MKYKDIKSLMQNVARELDGLRFQLSETTNELKSKQKDISKLSDSKKIRIEDEKKSSLIAFEKSIVDPYNDKIAKLENNKLKLKEKRDSILGTITSDNYKLKDKYQNKLNINSELKTCEELDQILNEYYGGDFQKVLNVIVEESDDIDSYQEIIKNVKLLKTRKNSNFDLSEFLNNVMDTLGLDGENEEGQMNEQVPICLAIGIVFVLILVFAYPLLIALFVTPLVYNLVRSHYYLKAKSYCKSLINRKDEIEGAVDREIELAVERDKNKLNTQYEEVNRKIDSKIKDLEHESEIELERQRPSFIFSTTDIDKEYEARESSLKNKIRELETTSKKLDSEIHEKSDKLTKLRTELNKSLKDLMSDYLGLTDSYKDVLPVDYLFDIVDGEPKFFKIPKESAIFFYDTEETLNKFIDLIYYQTISRVQPTLLSFYYLDYKYLGEKFISSKDLSCVQVGDKESNGKLIENIGSIIRKRMPIMSQFDSIEDYNTFMKNQDCIGEQYVYIYNVYSDLDSLLSDANKSICNVGPRYGVYNYYFVDSKEIDKSNYQKLCDIFDTVSKYYKISNKGIRKGCKEFYLAQIEALNE